MTEVLICDGVRTPIGRYGGALAGVRVDDLAAATLRALAERNSRLDPDGIDEVIFGCANQAGEDNRNVARMASLLADIPDKVPGLTINRLCGSGLSAVALGASLVKDGADLVIAGGVEGMSRAPFVMGKPTQAFDRAAKLEDTTMGWRFVNPRLAELHGTEAMPQTAENVALEFGISRDDQDAFALRSHQKAAQAIADGAFSGEIIPIAVNGSKSELSRVATIDEHPRTTTLEGLAALKPLFPNGTVTAGNSSGINDGAAALILCSERGAARHGLSPIARIVGSASAGVAPRIMGIGPVPATRKLLEKSKLTIDDFDVIELNEAFASQALACLRLLELPDDDQRVNRLGGAIALGHPLGMSGARIVLSAARQLERDTGQFGLCTMCVGVGQGVSIALERV